jgi:hypothetical protein
MTGGLSALTRCIASVIACLFRITKIMMLQRVKDIDSLQVETVITPFTVNDEKETVANLMTATGGKAIMSQREGIEYLGRSADPDETLRQIPEESKQDAFDPTV